MSPPVVSENKVTLSATSLAGASDGDGTLATVTFEALNVKPSVIGAVDVLLTDSEGEPLLSWAHGTRVVEPTLLPSSAIVSLNPASALSPSVGENHVLSVNIAGGQDVADYKFAVDYDSSALSSPERSPGDYLAGGVGNGDGTLESLTFEVLEVKSSKVSLSGYLVAPNGLRYLPTFQSAAVIVPLEGDVNRDGAVNILDLVLVASSFGQPVGEGGNPADVNEDGVVNVIDLVKVAGGLGAAAAPASNPQLLASFALADMQEWLAEARQLNLADATSQQGILFLERLLEALAPKKTALLPNYPNPFNPETWIPYRLAHTADVQIIIYDAMGASVRQLALGVQSPGIYTDRSKAAYWDGRNESDEAVASGVYFYQLRAGEYSATKRMVILK